MENNSKTFTSSSTQTDGTSNKGMGRTPLRSDPEISIYPLGNQINMPEYRKNLAQVFGEEFLAEATLKDKQLAPLIKIIRERDWNTMKTVNPYFYSLKRDLSVTPSGCILYDNHLMVPKSLKQLVIDSIHQTHPGQLEMLRLADLICFPRIHRDVTYKAQSCSDCIRNGKNLKAIQTKSQLGTLPKLIEHNEEIQMDCAGPLSFREHKDDYYILVTVDHLTRYPHAKVFKNCDTETALKYLEEYCDFHGIPRSIRCDQAQAFKAREFELYCKDKKYKTNTRTGRRS